MIDIGDLAGSDEDGSVDDLVGHHDIRIGEDGFDTHAAAFSARSISRVQTAFRAGVS